MYLIIGSGKVARHLSHYFELLQIPYSNWNRKQNTKSQLDESVATADTVLLAISDRSLPDIFSEYPVFKSKPTVHFSGAYCFDNMIDAHPLVSFSNNLFDLEFYEKIPLVSSKPDQVKTIFKNLKNPIVEIQPEKKALYHALCVISGNFSNILWKKYFEDVTKITDLNLDQAKVYAESCFKNILTNPMASLTGPLSRGDQDTIYKNLQALDSDPFKMIYESFVQVYCPNIGGQIEVSH